MSLYTIRSGVNNHPEDSFLQELTDIVRKGGVFKLSTDLIVAEPGGGGLNVDVSSGRAYVKSASSSCFPVRNTATATVAVSSNGSGNPRITTIILYVDLATSPSASGGGNDVAKLLAVDGTPAGSPVAPNDATIQAAIGANDPFIRLANVTVASGATGISNANIDSVAKRVFMKTPKPLYPESISGSYTIDYLNSDQQRLTMTGDIVLAAPSNMEIGDMLKLTLVQDGTGGRAVTWFTTITDMSPDVALASNLNQETVYVIEKITASTYRRYLAGKSY